MLCKFSLVSSLSGGDQSFEHRILCILPVRPPLESLNFPLPKHFRRPPGRLPLYTHRSSLLRGGTGVGTGPRRGGMSYPMELHAASLHVRRSLLSDTGATERGCVGDLLHTRALRIRHPVQTGGLLHPTWTWSGRCPRR